MRIKLLFLLFFFSAYFAFPEEKLDISWDVGNFGWGMGFPNKESGHEFNLRIFDLFMEDKNTNIGLILSPFNIHPHEY